MRIEKKNMAKKYITTFGVQASVRNIIDESYEDTVREFSSPSMVDFIEYDEIPLQITLDRLQF